MSTVHGIVRYKVKAGSEEAFVPLLRAFVEGVRSEPGNLRFDAYQDIEDPRTYVLLGTYASEEAVAEHREAEHFATMARDLLPLLEDRSSESLRPA